MSPNLSDCRRKILNVAIMLAAGELTPAGFKKNVAKLDVLAKPETIKLEAAAKASAQRLADGIQKHAIDGLCKLLYEESPAQYNAL
jgi:hypothetical protein